MNRKHTFLLTMGLIFILFVGTLLYAILRDGDPYRYFTGLGSEISIAPDDSNIAFSYYTDGEESIYTANLDGSHVRKLSHSNGGDDRQPDYSPDGNKLVYLTKEKDGIQTLWIMKKDGSNSRQLTSNELHVTDAIFSYDGETIYFVAVEAAEFMEGEKSREGFDLFSMKTDGGQMKQLTNTNHFSMNNLFLSPDGNTMYYSEFDGVEERIYSYAIQEGELNVTPSLLPKEIASTQSFYEAQLSPRGNYLVYKEVSEVSQESSLFEYELFLVDLKTNRVDRLTKLRKSVSSPVFFHEGEKIAFLENTNWPEDPAVYQLKTIDIQTKDIGTITLDVPKSAGGNRFIQMLDNAVNSYTVGILYILWVGLLSVYLHHYYPRKVYVPSLASFSIAILILMVSFAVAAMVNPWYGIGLGMLAAALFVCSVIVFLFVFIYKRLAR